MGHTATETASIRKQNGSLHALRYLRAYIFAIQYAAVSQEKRSVPADYAEIGRKLLCILPGRGEGKLGFPYKVPKRQHPEGIVAICR